MNTPDTQDDAGAIEIPNFTESIDIKCARNIAYDVLRSVSNTVDIANLSLGVPRYITICVAGDSEPITFRIIEDKTYRTGQNGSLKNIAIKTGLEVTKRMYPETEISFSVLSQHSIN